MFKRQFSLVSFCIGAFSTSRSPQWYCENFSEISLTALVAMLHVEVCKYREMCKVQQQPPVIASPHVTAAAAVSPPSHPQLDHCIAVNYQCQCPNVQLFDKVFAMSDTQDPYIIASWAEQLLTRQQPDTQIKSLINVLLPAPPTHIHTASTVPGPGARNIFVHKQSTIYEVLALGITF